MPVQLEYYDPREEALSDLIRRRRLELGYRSVSELAQAMVRHGERAETLATRLNRYEQGQIGRQFEDDIAARLAVALRVEEEAILYALFVQHQRGRKVLPPDSLIVGPRSEMPELATILEVALRNERARRRIAEDIARYDDEGRGAPLGASAEEMIADLESDARAADRKARKRLDQKDSQKGTERTGT